MVKVSAPQAEIEHRQKTIRHKLHFHIFMKHSEAGCLDNFPGNEGRILFPASKRHPVAMSGL
jgi:hypothetical protein